MKIFYTILVLLLPLAVLGQPSTTGPMPGPPPDLRPDTLHKAYRARANEVLQHYVSSIDPEKPESFGRGQVVAKLALRQDPEIVSERVIEQLQGPQSGEMFWMFPWTAISFLGRDQLTPEAKAAIRTSWRTYSPLRGDTENHWVMYYTSLYLMAELYPDDPEDSWFNGKSSAENRAEAKEFLIDWMDIATTIGQGEFNPTHYIGEYAIPMLYLASWATDPEMKMRGQMKLDWLMADLAENTINGVLRGPNARTDDTSVVQRWLALATYFSWQMFGNTVPPPNYGSFGLYFAAAAENYQLPEVIYHIATDRDHAFVQRDLKRTRRRWRYSDELMPLVYKTNYMSRDYAVGSTQGGLITDPIQAHVWDVTWAVPDPRGVHNTMFSVHPHSDGKVMQMYFTELPDHMIEALSSQGKPSYDVPDKILGSSPFEQVFQDLDTVIALYDIPEGTRFPHINGFFSKDLTNVTVDASGWIFAQGGNTYLAYRPLAGYEWQPRLGYKQLPSTSGYKWDRINLGEKGDKLLYSPHRKNGTIVQAASADDFKDFTAFQTAMRALPLEYSLEPVPTVRFTTLRGRAVAFTYDQAPIVDGTPVDYSKWKLFEGPYLNAEKGSRKLTLTHGRLERVLDFNTLTITDTVKGP